MVRKRRKNRVRVASALLDSTRPNPISDAYYSNAIGGAADDTLDRGTRLIAQNRCESEYLNETIVFSAATKSMSLVVGSGPVLKILGPRLQYNAEPVPDLNKKCNFLEQCFNEFANDIKLNEVLQLVAREEIYHGEVILRKVPYHLNEAGFRYVLIRPERLGTGFDHVSDPMVYDGIRYDRPGDGGVPICYYIQKEYINPTVVSFDYEEVPADEIIHFFTPILPQQHRGLPPMQSALPRIAQLRKLISATLTAAVNSAKMAIVLKTDNEGIMEAVSDSEGLRIYNPGPDNTLKTFEMQDGGIYAPPGYEPVFCDPKHPTAEFGNVKKIISADIGSTIGIGSGKINNDHSSYNYSSAKMDQQVDDPLIKIRQAKIASEILDTIFNDWIVEHALIDSIADEFLIFAQTPARVQRKWLFPEPQSLDEVKDAQADDIRLKNGTITREEIFSKRRLDCKDEMEKWKSENELLVPPEANLPTSENTETYLPTLENNPTETYLPEMENDNQQ